MSAAPSLYDRLRQRVTTPEASQTSLARTRDTKCQVPLVSSLSVEGSPNPQGTIGTVAERMGATPDCSHYRPGEGWFDTPSKVVCAACYRRRRRVKPARFFGSIAELKDYAETLRDRGEKEVAE